MSEESIKEQMPALKNGWTATTLKLIAIVCMFIDHIGAFVVERLISSGIWRTDIILLSVERETLRLEYLVDYILRAIGRVSFPLFCFFIVEGFIYTHNRALYALRLFVFALISQLPYYIALNGLGDSIGKMLIPSNVYYTLLIGLIVIWSSETLKKYAPGGYVAFCFRILVCIVPTSYAAYEIYSILSYSDELAAMPYLFIIVWMGLAAATLIGSFVYAHLCSKEAARALSSSLTFLGFGMLIADFLGTDYGGVGVLAIFIMYVASVYGVENATHRRKMAGAGIAISVLTMSNIAEIFAFADMILIGKYNGQRGKGYKYLFYAFYPVHIAVIVLVLYLIGLI